MRELRVGALGKFLRMPRRERGILLHASARLLLVHAALMFMPLPAVQHRLDRRASARRPVATPVDAGEIARLVKLADRHGLLPPSCLRRSLVLAWFLSDRGMAPSLRIGIARHDDRLQAHAWVELAGRRFFEEPGFSVLS